MWSIRRMPSRIFLMSTLLLILSSSSAAQHIATNNSGIPPKWEARLTWDGNAFYRIHKDRSYENLVLFGALIHAYQANPNLDVQAELTALNDLHAEYKQKYLEADGQYHLPQTPIDAVQTMLNLGGAYGGKRFALLKPIADEVLKWGVKGYEMYARGPKQIAAQRFLADTASYSELLGKYVDQAYVLAQDNPKAKEVIDTFFGKTFNANVDDTSEAILTKNPDFSVSADVKHVLASSADNASALKDLKATVVAQNAQLAKELVTVRTYLAELSTEQAKYFAAKDEAEKKQIREQEEKASYQINIDGAKSSVYLLATTANFLKNEKLSHEISVTGYATIQMVDSIHKYNEALRTSTTDLNRVASAVTLAANWVSAGLTIASLFDAGKTDSFVADQLNAIRQQLIILREEMHDRFDRIDLKLNQLYETMTTQFGVLVDLLNKQQIALSDIQATTARLDEGLFQLSIGMTSLEVRINQFVTKATVTRQLNRELEVCFAANQMPSASAFDDCLRDLTFTALDTTLDPLADAQYDDEAIYRESAVVPIASDYPYMARIGGEKIKNATMSGLAPHVVNPINWSFGTDSYLDLAQKWPKLYMRADPVQIDELIAAGTKLRSMGMASRDPAVSDWLLSNYQQKADLLRQALIRAEDKFKVATNDGNPIRRGDKVFTNYSTPIAISNGSLPPCTFLETDYKTGSATQVLSLPKGIEKFIKRDEYRMADTMKISQIEFCYQVPVYTRAKSSPSQICYNGDHYKLCSAALAQAPAIRVLAYMLDPSPRQPPIFIFDREVTSASAIVWLQVGKPGVRPDIVKDDNPVGDAIGLWESELKAKFLTESTEDNPESKADVDKIFILAGPNWPRVRELLNQHFDQLTSNFYRQLVSTDFKGTNDVAAAARELDVAKILAQAFISVGFADELCKDESLRSLLFGNESLPDGDAVAASFDLAVNEPRNKYNDDARKRLAEMHIEVSTEGLVASVKASNADAVTYLVSLGVWDNLMTQGERAAVINAANALDQTAESSKTIQTVLKDANQSTFDRRFLNDQAALSQRPYELLTGTLKQRSTALHDQLQTYQKPSYDAHFPVIDETLARLSIFKTYHSTKPQTGLNTAVIH
jgi:hypothetical protein